VNRIARRARGCRPCPPVHPPGNFLAAYRGRHVWSDAVVAERFHRWKDELHLLVVDVSPLPSPITLPWHESYGGCRSWVELQDDARVAIDATGA